MEESSSTRFSVSYHLKDLLKYNPATIQEIANWLEVNANKPRDVARRVSSRRLMARLLAARCLLDAANGNVQALKEVMDRTEGKVKDTLEVTTRSLSLHIDLGGDVPRETLLHTSSETLDVVTPTLCLPYEVCEAKHIDELHLAISEAISDLATNHDTNLAATPIESIESID